MKNTLIIILSDITWTCTNFKSISVQILKSNMIGMLSKIEKLTSYQIERNLELFSFEVKIKCYFCIQYISVWSWLVLEICLIVLIYGFFLCIHHFTHWNQIYSEFEKSLKNCKIKVNEEKAHRQRLKESKWAKGIFINLRV